MDLVTRKETLVYACKVLAMEGHRDIIWGHASLRIPGENAFLMKPSGLGLEELIPEDIITVDMEGNKIAGDRGRHGEWPIHSEIMRARPEINCVVHTHPPYATTFSALDQKILPIQHEGAHFTKSLPVFTHFSDLIVTKEMGQLMTECMGNNYAMLLRNHGIVTAGRTVGEAIVTAIFLEKACMCQLLANQYGGPIHWSSDQDVSGKYNRFYTKTDQTDLAFEYYIRRVKSLEKSGLPI